MELHNETTQWTKLRHIPHDSQAPPKSLVSTYLFTLNEIHLGFTPEQELLLVAEKYIFGQFNP